MPISNSADAYRLQYIILSATGAWPKENPTILYRFNTFLSWFYGLGLYGIMLTQCIHDITDITKLSETLYIMVSFMGFIIKFLVFTYRKKEFLDILEFLKDPVFVSYPEDLDHYMVKTIKSWTLLSKVYQFLIICCIILYLIYPILDNKALPFAFPYDLGQYNIVMYGFQLIGEYYSANNNIYLDVLCASLMGIIAAQLDILAEKIIRIRENDSVLDEYEISIRADEEAIKRLKQCVVHHLAIIKVVNSIENVFTIGLLAQFVASALVICNTIFDFVLVPVSSQLFLLVDYLIIILVQLFIYCWYGNEIIVKSFKIGEACFMSKWYMSDNRVRKYLFIIMERCKRPMKITVMKISILSLAAFASILQWSYSYLALLLKMYSKKSLQSTN
ncbi:hypothetical protein ILUMI_01326 [Ignelater luminosus]|uniref:Odorant receptor n=1 Tax=Ignelater luminosus TaxID=2038154 RepID=A0A8K0DQY6_IGNLU|nr:hypothetical protein ILUMI_01326 [Ignelater luminosus]